MAFKKGDAVIIVYLDNHDPAPIDSIGMTGVIKTAANKKERRHRIEFPNIFGVNLSSEYWFYDHEIVKVAGLTELENVVYGL